MRGVLDLNRAERRALWLGTTLFALGVAARLGLGPGAADSSWRPAPPGAAAAGASQVRQSVAEGIARAEHAARPLAPGERIDPNTAPTVELERLPGVGPARARAIAEERRAAPFRTLEDLARVPGIGAATLRRLGPHVALPAGSTPGTGGGDGPALGGARGSREGAAPDRDPAVGASAGRPPLDLNRASAQELERLPGIGPQLARRILELRARRGRLRHVDDLLAVPGIGPVTLERLRPLVAVR